MALSVFCRVVFLLFAEHYRGAGINDDVMGGAHSMYEKCVHISLFGNLKIIDYFESINVDEGIILK
jgi:hypothetical protein